MENNDRNKPECESVTIPLSLIRAMTVGIIEALADWHEERKIVDYDTDKCFLAMIASVEAAMEAIGAEGHNMTIQ